MQNVAANALLPAPIALTCLGAFTAVFGGRPITNFPTDKVRALFAYLALEAGPHRREALAGLLWPDVGQDYALKNLRNSLHRLRQTLERAAPGIGDGLFAVTRQTIALNRAVLDVDVAKFEALIVGCERHQHDGMATCAECLARLTQAADLYRSELLVGFGLEDAPAFEEWLMVRRESLHQHMLLCLHALVEAHERRGDFASALTYANRQLALDPYREDAHRQVMRTLARSGQTHHALAHYDACRRLLREELGVAPDGETTALCQQIRAGKFGSAEAERQRGGGAIGDRQSTIENWIGVPDAGPFFGREAEAATLRRWLVHDHCRVVVVSGMGGVGKTTLAASVSHAVANRFERVLWQSLLNAPPVSELLQTWLQALAGQSLTSLPANLDAQLALLLDGLRRERCLLILDNVESILQADQPGRTRPGYEDYDRLIQHVADYAHGSCLLLTSRERPHGLARREGDAPLVHTLTLEGLDVIAGRAMLAARGLSGADGDITALIRRYSGNPLALKLVAQTIRELFGGDVAAFLRIETPIFDDIRAVLDGQFARLLPLEREIMLWLAIEREPVSVQALHEDLVHPPPIGVLLEALRALQRRSLVGQNGQGLHLQNVVTEYVTEVLVGQVTQEISGFKLQIANLGLPNLQSAISNLKFNTFALLKATAKEPVRASQVRLIVQPIVARLSGQLGRAGVVAQLNGMLAELRTQPTQTQGYTAGNVLNLLLHLGVDVRGYDFSGLNVWQAYLQDKRLPDVNFRDANLSRSVFTHLFGEILAVQFAGDGQLLVAGVIEGKLALWQAGGGQSLREHRTLGAGATIASFSPDGRLLASGHTDHTAQVWEVASGRLLRTLVKHTETPWCLTFSWDNRRVATSGADGSVHVWDAGTGVLLHSPGGHAAAVPALAFSRDGRTLASGDVNGEVCLWEIKDLPGSNSSEPIRTLRGHAAEVHHLTFDASGEILASGSHDRTIRLWDTASGGTKHMLRAHTHAIRTMAISPDGHTLVSGGFDTFVCAWDVGSGRALHTFLDLGHACASLAFSAEGQTIAAAAVEQVVSLLDLAAGEQVDALHAHSNRLYSIDFSPDGRTLVSGGTDCAVRLWDVSKPGQVVHTLLGHAGWIRAVVISPTGEILASASDDGTIRLWDMHGHLIRSLLGHSDHVESIAFSPDGQALVSAGSDATLRVWDVSTGQLLRVLKGHDGRIYACAFSPNGRLIASGGADRTVRVWGVWEVATQPVLSGAGGLNPSLRDTGQALFVLRGHTNGVKCVTFSPDGRLLASGSFDHTMRLWEISAQPALSGAEGLSTSLGHTGRELSTLRPQAASIVSLAFGTDGGLLAFAAADHRVRLVDMRTGQGIRTIQGHSSSVECVRFSPDGQVLASAGMNETIKLWDVSTGQCLQTLRAPGPYAGMNITGVTGISSAQKSALKALGAVELPS